MHQNALVPQAVTIKILPEVVGLAVAATADGATVGREEVRVVLTTLEDNVVGEVVGTDEGRRITVGDALGDFVGAAVVEGLDFVTAVVGDAVGGLDTGDTMDLLGTALAVFSVGEYDPLGADVGCATGRFVQSALMSGLYPQKQQHRPPVATTTPGMTG